MRRTMMILCAAWLLASLAVGDAARGRAADPHPATAPGAAGPTAAGPSPAANAAARADGDAAAQRDETFRKMVTGVKLSGHFTMDGDENAKLQPEEYLISGATKLGAGDVWALTARIKYGKTDLTLPVPVQVKWAGNTPVITLDKVPVPGLGTFSARVVLDEGRYAGTWSHDAVGGHLFGRITKVTEEQAPAPAR